MQDVLITNNNDKISLYLSDNKFFGYKINDYFIEKVNSNVFKYFSFLLPSSDFSILDDVDGYKVILDNKTNFKHYYKDGCFNIEKFFINNGEYDILFDKKNKFDLNFLKNIKKVFKVNSSEVVVTSLFSLSLIFSYFNFDVNIDSFSYDYDYSLSSLNYDTLNYYSFNDDNDDYNIEYIYNLRSSINDSNSEEIINKLLKNVFLNYNYTVDDIFYLIDHSINLNEKEKLFFKNEEIISKVLPYINNDPYLKYTYLNRFYNLDIVPFTSLEEKNSSGGYYLSDNKLHVCNYKGNLEEKDIVAHEYMHVFQYPSAEYGFLIEASAELISYEFYNKYSEIKLDGYSSEVIRLKVLMEMIGSEAVFKYCISGDFSLIEENVKPYLNEFEFLNFCEILKKTTVGLENENIIIYDLDTLLGKIYVNKYGKDMLSDENIVNIYVKKDKNKSYFNEKNLNNDYTIIEDCDNICNLDSIKRKKYIFN